MLTSLNQWQTTRTSCGCVCKFWWASKPNQIPKRLCAERHLKASERCSTDSIPVRAHLCMRLRCSRTYAVHSFFSSIRSSRTNALQRMLYLPESALEATQKENPFCQNCPARSKTLSDCALPLPCLKQYALMSVLWVVKVLRRNQNLSR